MSISKYLFAGVFSLISASFIACGDDSSSDSSYSGSGREDLTAPVTFQIEIGELSKEITRVRSSLREVCVYENATYDWQERMVGSDTSKVKYLFVGDTLVLYRAGSNHGVMMVGGSADNVRGTWKTTSPACSYDIEDKETTCGVFERPVYAKYEISNDQMTRQLVFQGSDDNLEQLISDVEASYYARHRFEKHAMSHLTSQILRNIMSNDFDRDEFGVFSAFSADTASLECLAHKKGVKVRYENVRDNFMDVVIVDSENDNEYPVSIDYKKASVDEDGFELDVTVSFNDKIAELKVKGSEMNKGLCKDDNEPYFETEKQEAPDGSTFTYVDAYASSNLKEFASAMSDMFKDVSEKLEKNYSGSCGGYDEFDARDLLVKKSAEAEESNPLKSALEMYFAF